MSTQTEAPPPATVPGDLIEQMRTTSFGSRCARCLQDGRVNTHNRDGTPITEEHRCPGCGELICDRHPGLQGGLAPTLKHALSVHADGSADG